jgi:hypothetical protein
MKPHCETHISPWSVNLQVECGFVSRHTAGDLSSSVPAASFRDASDYLDKFYTDRNVSDQSQAALSAVILLPSMISTRGLSLPFPNIAESRPSCSPADLSPRTRSGLHHPWTCDSRRIDKLLALSCNYRGIRPMLLSTFYVPSVECNAITPWLQGTLTAIERLAGSQSYWTTRM